MTLKERTEVRMTCGIIGFSFAFYAVFTHDFFLLLLSFIPGYLTTKLLLKFSPPDETD